MNCLPVSRCARYFIPSNPVRRAFFAGLALAFSQAVTAADIEVITVSAQPVNLDDTGSSVTVISREAILRRNATSIVNLLREVPGFAVSQQGSQGSVAQVRVRGAEANQVLVLINGIEANDLAQGGEFDFSQVTTADIERIEIVRGPQSALWGSDAMAGVVNIITSPGGGEQSSGYTASLEAGSFGTTHAGISATTRNPRLSNKLTVDYLDSGGTNISRTGSEDDGLENLTLGVSGNFAVTGNVDARYTLRYTDKVTEFDQITSGLPADAPYETASNYLVTGLELAQQINDSLSHRIRLSRTGTDSETQAASPVKNVFRGVKDSVRYQFDANRDKHLLTLLAEHETEDYEQRGEASFFGDPNQNLDTRTSSIAFEYRFDGGPLNLSLSARSDNNSEFDDGSAWRVTANYQFSQTTVFASAGESHKNPTFTERFGFFTNFTGNPTLEPEESLHRELGIRQRLFDGDLNLSLTYFNADLENEINGFVFDPATAGFTSANVDGESTREGIEATLNYDINDRLSFAATYTYLDAEQEDAFGNYVTEVRRPENSGSLSAHYQWEKAGLHLAVSRTGEQEDDYFPPFPPFQERVALDAFTLVSLAGYYQLNDFITFTGRLENVTDEDYEQVFGFKSPGFGGYLGLRLSW